MKNYPNISVIIPTYNSMKTLSCCLESIWVQDYPREKIEILVIDDNSEDNTIKIAKKYGAKIFVNGHRNIERGKSIGLENANSEYILLIDSDNILPTHHWLGKCIDVILENPEIVGVQAAWFKYNPTDTLTDRYCSLFGINDPFAFYFQKRDRLMQIEQKWELPGEIIKETPDYFLVEFNENNLLTVGSQGFLTRKELLLKTNYKPYLFHIDSNLELVKQGFSIYGMMKLDIIHLHSESIQHFFKKLERNMKLYLEQKNIRTYKWRISPIRLLITVLIMLTVIKPFYDSLRGYIKKPDFAWFLHPFFCIIVVILYSYISILYKILSIKQFVRSQLIKEVTP